MHILKLVSTNGEKEKDQGIDYKYLMPKLISFPIKEIVKEALPHKSFYS